MKQTISLKAPGRAFNLPTVSISGATVRRVLPQFFQKGVARVGNNSDICSALHFFERRRLGRRQHDAVGFYFVHVICDITSSVPCGALMRPLPSFKV